MNAIKKYFNQIKWYEYVYMTIFIVLLITLGVIYHSNVLILANSIIGICAIFNLAKGLVLGNFLSALQTILYCVICYFNSYYGEIISGVCITLPICFISIVTWLKNKDEENVVKVTNKVKLKEWTILFIVVMIISFIMYFVLQALNTQDLLVSTFSVAFLSVAGYLLARRCEYNFIFYIICNMVCVVLWSLTVFGRGDLTSLPTLVCYIIFLILNCFGLFNWIRLKKIAEIS